MDDRQRQRIGLASHSSPNLPSSCTLVETKRRTEVFTVPDYSKWERMAAGNVAKFDKFGHGDVRYRLKVYPAGFDEESAGYVAIFVTARDKLGPLWFRPGVRLFIEILDVGGERAVFSNRTATSEQTLVDRNSMKGYVRFVKRRELEESSCLRADDSFTVRCTVYHHLEVTKKLTSTGAPPGEEDTPSQALVVHVS